MNPGSMQPPVYGAPAPEEEHKGLGDYLAALKRRKVPLAAATAAILAASLGVAFGLPPAYQATATILIEQQEIPQDLVRSTVASYANERLQMVSQRVMTRSHMGEIIDRHELYAETLEREPLESVIERMREQDITIELVSAEVVDPRSGRPREATIAFTLSYQNESPRLAHRVANDLATLFLRENATTRQEQAEEAASFLEGQAERLAQRVAKLEEKLATFKEKHFDQLPELTDLNLQLMDRTERELIEVARQIRSLQERKIYLESELAQMDPTAVLYSETGERVLGPADKLKVLQTEYLSAAARYSSDHPDVVRLRKEIRALEAETGASGLQRELQAELQGLRAELAAASERYSDEHPDVKRLARAVASLEEELEKVGSASSSSSGVKPNNPAYIDLQARLDAAESELESLRERRRELQQKLAGYERRLTATPQVERQYRELTREYETAVAKYQEVKAKALEAQIARSLESEGKGEQFTLIESPVVPEEPAKPNRLAIGLLGVVFSFAGGVGTAAVSESLDQTVRGVRGVTALVHAPPLAAIPPIRGEAHLRSRRRRWLLAAVALLALGCAALAALHFAVAPLDVLWFKLLNRAGL